ncbi:AcrR family transcriptional regulator [Rhizomicrobium palustre]|uniref:AcrR family transcriptional regulator n=1 Tax=Rhizomicrobium palustre TaxID=189966 RepID=A0A846N0Z1_9PROT|nr:TetR/AcrR family transcriptional regulator [Rhizomicrobium palustre]NIK88830.1 AcrR family transcriptional regulator [Rhizomicrobium palustre]
MDGIASKGKREQTKIQNRALILNAARQVFADLGYGATTVRDIIRATPLASGTFYNYFKSKEEVYQAIRDEVALAIRPRLSDERRKATSVEEFIRCTFRTFFEYVAGDRMNFHTIRHAESTRLRTPEVIAGFEELREDIESAVAKNVFPPLDADFLMAAMVGVAFEVAEQMLKREPLDPEAAADFATGLFIGGVRAIPEAQPATKDSASDVDSHAA